MVFLYDGTYGSFLTAIFEAFERRIFEVNIIEKKQYQQQMFDEIFDIIYDEEKSKRVLKGITEKAGPKIVKDVYRCFLSEDPKAINALFRLLIRLFKVGPTLFDNYGDSDVLLFHQTLKKIGRERHRMEAFIRFQNSSDGLFWATIEPDFNVLPLITQFFKNRFNDQPWLIYDVKRDYGMMYNLKTIEEVQLTPDATDAALSLTPITDEEDEVKYQNLWKLYFNSTNIKERKNIKLHLRHVPRRYWKYLIEKQ